MKFNYSKICTDLLCDLPKKQKEIILRRFGLKKPGKKETLEAIGKSYGITRERVRQIEGQGMAKLKQKTNQHQKVFQYFTDQLKTSGSLRKEDVLLSLLGGENFQNQTSFLLTLGDPFVKIQETKDCFSLWTIDHQSVSLAKKVIDSFYQKLTKINKPVSLEDYKPPFAKITPQALIAFIEISKQIQQNPAGLFGLRNWPEINPRGVKDKAYLVLKQETRPLHFTEVASYIAETIDSGKRVYPNPQSVHNELIRDPRFVLVGRGLYALAEWGYTPGLVKDIILQILKTSRQPLSKQEITKEVLKQRFVKENTILLNLSDKKCFIKTPEGKYSIREI